MVATRGDGRIAHASFRDLPELLEPGDLLVINNSATLPAAVAARRADGVGARAPLRRPGAEHGRRGWWVVEPRGADGGAGRRLAAGARGRRAARRRDREPGRAVRGRAAPVAGPVARRRAAARVPVALRPPDPLLLRRRAAGRSTPSRPPTRSSRAAPRCRAPGGRSRRELITALVARGRADRPAHPPRRPLVARAPRAAAGRALRGPGEHRRRRQRRPRLGRARDRRRDDGRPGARDRRRRPTGRVAAGVGLDEPRDHARARAAGDRRPAQRLARARGLAPAAARGGRRRPSCSRAATRRRSSAAISGTSSATAT